MGDEVKIEETKTLATDEEGKAAETGTDGETTGGDGETGAGDAGESGDGEDGAE